MLSTRATEVAGKRVIWGVVYLGNINIANHITRRIIVFIFIVV